MSTLANSLPVDANAIADVLLFPIAKEFGLPPTDGELPNKLETTAVTIGGKPVIYDLLPHGVEKARVVYYTARNQENSREEIVIGPEALEEFSENIFLYATATSNFFGFLDGPDAFNVSSTMIGSLVVQGRCSTALRMLGNDWKIDLQDPDWWKMPLLSGDWLGIPLRGKRSRTVQPIPLGKGEL
jgi:hypothetical protein